MKRISFIILILLAGCMSSYCIMSYAAVDIPGIKGTGIQDASIHVDIETNGSIDSAKNFGFQLLGALKVAISGIALIYLVMIGVHMVIGSDSEETIKTQRKQITYALIGFLFLNIPSLVYTIFSPDTSGGFGGNPDWQNINGGSVFWSTAGFEGIIGDMIAFLKVFAFGAAVTMFTWGFFHLIISGGDDEKRKKAKNRIIYGILGLIFLGFVELWGQLIAVGDFKRMIPNVSGTLFSLVMYFSAPIAIFMIIWGSYYFITSAGDEERMKKGKSILINTGIALIILLSAVSFMSDLVKFQL